MFRLRIEQVEPLGVQLQLHVPAGIEARRGGRERMDLRVPGPHDQHVVASQRLDQIDLTCDLAVRGRHNILVSATLSRSSPS